MLAGLTIRNVVLIEQLDLQFRDGFCALTGETGAGKSILLDSLGLALGGRSDSGLIRKGTEQASVSAEFDVPAAHPVYAMLKDQGIAIDGSVILRRVLGADGRSRAFINDQPVSAGLLGATGDMLIEIHSQFETHGLLDPKTHGALLDEYAGLKSDVKTLNGLWHEWRTAQRDLDTARAEAEKAKADEEYLLHAVSELEKIDPQAGEEEQILIKRDGLKHRDQVLGALNESWEHISGDKGAEMSISRAAKALARVADKIGTDIGPVIEALDRAGHELQDAVGQVQSITASMDGGEVPMEVLEDRLYALRGLARKHHCQVDQLAGLLDGFKQKLNLITRQDGLIADLVKKVALSRTAYIVAGEKISAARSSAAEKLDREVAKELPPLKLDKARFITAVDTAGENG